jgi:hypothetical protein
MMQLHVMAAVPTGLVVYPEPDGCLNCPAPMTCVQVVRAAPPTLAPVAVTAPSLAVVAAVAVAVVAVAPTSPLTTPTPSLPWPKQLGWG